MANILLVYPAPEEFKARRFGFSLDLLYIASLLKQAGHCIVNYLDYSTESFDLEKFYTNADKAEVVILEFDSFPLKRAINIRHGENLVQVIIKRYGSGVKRIKKIVLFGNDISLERSVCRESRGAFFSKRDPLAAGGEKLEFDYALATGFENNINSVVDCLLKGNSPREIQPLDDLDQLPFPDRGLLTSYAQRGGTVDRKPKLAKSTLVRTSSGCLNSCVFCQRKGWHKKYMIHSIPYIIEEFSLLKSDNYRNIWICDDNFTYDLRRSKHLLKELARQQLTVNMKLALSSWTRIDKEFLTLASRANVSIISFGIESANREIQEFYRKPIHLEPFRDLVSFADSTGLYTVGNFIIGAPMETENSICETFDYILETPFDQVNIKILDYMAGSALYENLPAEKKTLYRHVFACKEEDLNDFPLNVLKEKINRFQKTFQEVRKDRLKEKVEQNGPPYHILH